MTKYQRLYEAAILKTLGAEKKLIACITLVEYGVLGLLAGLIGSSAAIGMTWTLSKTTFNIPWRFVPSVNLVGVAVTLLLVAVVGVLSSWDVMMKKPLGILRARSDSNAECGVRSAERRTGLSGGITETEHYAP